jgi:putative FmdB family regulatory protein
MPLYEYRCEACGEMFGKLQKMGAPEGEVCCPKCGAGEVKRQISSCSIGKGGSPAAGPSCSMGGG